MDIRSLSRRDFLRRSGMAAAGVTAASLTGCATGNPVEKLFKKVGVVSGKDTNILLAGDMHFNLPGDHDYTWIEQNNFQHETDVYCQSTANNFYRLMATMKRQALAANPKASAIIQVGDLLEGLAGTPEMATQMTRHTFEAIDSFNYPIPWIIAQGNHELTGPGQKEAWLAQAVPYLQKTLDPSISSMNYSYCIGDAQVVVLDPFNDQEGFIDFLEAELEGSAARYKLVALHEPVIPISCYCWHPLMRTKDYKAPRARLLEILARHKAIVLCGHIHRYSVLRRMTEWGPIVQVMAYSVLMKDNPKPPYTRETEYGPSLKDGRDWRPETLDERLAMLTEEAPYVSNFHVSKVAGYAMLTLGGDDEDKVELRYYEGLSTQPYETIDLAALQKTIEVA